MGKSLVGPRREGAWRLRTRRLGVRARARSGGTVDLEATSNVCSLLLFPRLSPSLPFAFLGRRPNLQLVGKLAAREED